MDFFLRMLQYHFLKIMLFDRLKHTESVWETLCNLFGHECFALASSILSLSLQLLIFLECLSCDSSPSRMFIWNRVPTYVLTNVSQYLWEIKRQLKLITYGKI